MLKSFRLIRLNIMNSIESFVFVLVGVMFLIVGACIRVQV